MSSCPQHVVVARSRLALVPISVEIPEQRCLMPARVKLPLPDVRNTCDGGRRLHRETVMGRALTRCSPWLGVGQGCDGLARSVSAWRGCSAQRRSVCSFRPGRSTRGCRPWRGRSARRRRRRSRGRARRRQWRCRGRRRTPPPVAAANTARQRVARMTARVGVGSVRPPRPPM